MTRNLQISRSWAGAAAAVLAALLLALPASSFAGQGRSRGGGGGAGGGGRAVPRSAPAPSPAPAAAPPPSAGTGAPAPASGGTPANGTTEGQPRSGQPTNRVGVQWGSVPQHGGTTVIVPGGYYGGYWPWGFAGLGFGGYYGLYDPFFPEYSGVEGYDYSTDGPDGSLRLKIKPRDGQVYVDGFYAGIVDDFDGFFQRLHITAGTHHVEVRAPGYEALAFDVQVRPDQTVTFERDLKRVQ